MAGLEHVDGFGYFEQQGGLLLPLEGSKPREVINFSEAFRNSRQTTPMQIRTMEDVYRTMQGGWAHNQRFIDNYLGINTKGSATNTYYLNGAARKAYEARYDADMIRALNEYEAAKKSVPPANEHPVVENNNDKVRIKRVNNKRKSGATRVKYDVHYIGEDGKEHIKSFKTQKGAEKFARSLKFGPTPAPIPPESPVAPEGKKPVAPEQSVAPEAGTKTGKGFLNSIKKVWSTKGGKAGIIAGIGIVAGAVLFGMSTCEGDKKQQLPPANPEPKKKPEPQPASKKPAQPVPPAQSEEPEKSEENQAQQPENTEVSVVKGSHEWGYAELELIAEHLGQAGYRPTNQEITDRMMQIIERENKTLEEAKANDPEGKNRHSVPTLKVGDDLKVSPELKKVIDEATKELKEAHKDNPNYKVTWTELRAKVQEKIAA